MNRIPFVALLTLLAIGALAGDAGTATTDEPEWYSWRKTCNPDTPGSPSVRAKDIIPERLPTFPALNTPDSCKAKASELQQRWMAEEVSNWDRVSNQACSHALGWVEKVPGTCQAGGPPPLCPVDHWVRKPAESSLKWKKLQDEVREKRQRELQAMLCDCWTAHLEVSVSETRAEEFVPQPGTDKGFVVPCTPGVPCPDPYKCYLGTCRAPNGLDAAVGAAVEVGSDKAIQALLAKAIDLALGTTTPLFVPSPGKLFVGVFFGAPLTPNKAAYDGKLRQIEFRLARLKYLYSEAVLYNNTGVSGRDPRYIRDEIKEQKVALIEDAGSLNNYFQAISAKQELGGDVCYEVFGSMHRLMLRRVGLVGSGPALPRQN